MSRKREKSPTGRRDHGVTRRDFIHDVGLAGLALGLGSAASLRASAQGAATTGSAEAARYYPPARTGMRGTHPGAFETAHALARERREFPAPSTAEERYDLVIVGAGISGLAAAYFYRQQHDADARILLLDNHDDFGGHAKRNEFHQGGPMRLGWGGTVNIEYWNYSEVGHRLLREIGVDLDRLLEDFSFNWADSGTGLNVATWFDAATYGKDELIPGLSYSSMDAGTLEASIERIPISDAGRESLRRFVNAPALALADLPRDELGAFLHGTRYADFLREQGRLTADAIQIFSGSMYGIWGVRADDLSIAEAFESGLPGTHLLGLDASEFFEREHGPAAMFPDGNASIARLLVRSLIPAAFPEMNEASDPFRIVAARLEYAELDGPASTTRLRLNSTVVHVENTDEGVRLHYARDGELRAVQAKQCVLACYNRIIPHLCPSLPEAQKTALGQCIKRPMGTINVLLRNGRAIERSGISQAYLPGSMLQLVTLVTGVDAGPYDVEWDPEDPCLLHFFFGVPAPAPEGLSMVEQSRAGRLRLLAMGFDDFEQEVRRVLLGIWGASGLDPDEDMLAITVNRWPHGYARDLLDLEDESWLATPGPYEIGRQPFGNIAIANSDAGADAYTHTAIDQAWRAVNDLVRLRKARRA